MKVTDTKGVKWLVVLPIKILSLAGLWWKTTVSAYSLPCLCWIAFSCNPVAGINVSYARFWKTTDKFKLSVSFCWNLMFVPLQLFLSVSLSSHHCVCLSLGTKTIWFGLGLAGNTCSGCHHKKKQKNKRLFRSPEKNGRKNVPTGSNCSCLFRVPLLISRTGKFECHSSQRTVQHNNEQLKIFKK